MARLQRLLDAGSRPKNRAAVEYRSDTLAE